MLSDAEANSTFPFFTSCENVSKINPLGLQSRHKTETQGEWEGRSERER